MTKNNPPENSVVNKDAFNKLNVGNTNNNTEKIIP